MKKNYVRLLAAGVLTSALLTSCFDKNYDLDGMDQTVEINVNDLVLPLNIDELQLKSIINLKEDETIRVVDGQYCIVKEGTFASSPVKINPVTLTCDPINPSSKDFPKADHYYPDVYDPAAYTSPISLPVGSNPTPFKLEATSVPDCILGIDEVGCNLKITITMGLEGLDNIINGFRLHGAAGENAGFKIQLPKGLKDVTGIGSYDASTGVYTVPAKNWSGTSVDIDINVARVNFKEAGAKFNPATHTIIFSDNLSVDMSTRISIYKDNLPDTKTKMPEKITYFTRFNIHDMALKSFTGDFRYDIEDIDIPRVSLDGIPDVLSEDGSNIELVNPQIYLAVVNPVAGNPVKAETGMTVGAVRDDKVAALYTMDSPLEIKALDKSNYCLCPKPGEVDKFPAGYENATKHQFSSLGKILSGNGIPEALDINLVSPVLPKQHVTDLQIGGTLGKVEGTYCFFAPLQLAPGSVIKYAADSDGWFGDDMDDLEISHMSIAATVSTDTPISMKFTGYPLDREGNRIKGVTVDDVVIPANAKDCDILIKLEGEMKDLDGIHYEATAAPGEDSKALAEDMKIILKNVKVKVSGKYVTDLGDDDND